MRKAILFLFVALFLISFASAYTLYQENFTNLIGCSNNFTTPCVTAYDGNYNTYARFVGGGLNVNYSIPQYTQSAILQIRFGNNLTNFTIPSDCLDYSSLILDYILTESAGQEYTSINILCQNQTGDRQIYFVSEGGYKQNNYLYEEAVFWNIVEPVPSYQESGIYRTFESAGAGTSIFISILTIPLGYLIIILMLISGISAIILVIVEIIVKIFEK